MLDFWNRKYLKFEVFLNEGRRYGSTASLKVMVDRIVSTMPIFKPNLQFHII